LVGLNSENDQVHIQILGKEKVPRLNEVRTIIQSEESRQNLMLETPIIESITMVVEEGKTMVVNQKKNGFFITKKKHEEVWYSYYNKTHHTRKKC